MYKHQKPVNAYYQGVRRKKRLTRQNYYTGKCVKRKLFEVMHPLCILDSDIMQKGTPPAGPVPSQGSESGLSDDSLPPIYLPNVLPIINIYHNIMAGIAGVNSLLPSLSQRFPLWSGGLIL